MPNFQTFWWISKTVTGRVRTETVGCDDEVSLVGGTPATCPPLSPVPQRAELGVAGSSLQHERPWKRPSGGTWRKGKGKKMGSCSAAGWALPCSVQHGEAGESTLLTSQNLAWLTIWNLGPNLRHRQSREIREREKIFTVVMSKMVCVFSHTTLMTESSKYWAITSHRLHKAWLWGKNTK